MSDLSKLFINKIENINLIDDVYSYPDYSFLEAQAAHSRYKHLDNVKNKDVRSCSSAMLSEKTQAYLANNVEPIVYEYAKKNNISISNKSYQLVRYTKGQFFVDHTDTTEEFPRKISTLLYVNDDYLGGEIVFTKLNLPLKPEKNTLIIFPSSSDFSHSAEPITSGTKYVIVGFWS